MFQKVKDVLRQQLTMGATPEKLAQSFVWGMFIGVFPLIGTTTALSVLIAWMFRLNHVVIQTANYLMYPIHIIMIPIYIKTVDYFFDVGYVPLRPDLMVHQFKVDPTEFLRQYGIIAIYAVGLWIIMSGVLYFILYPIILKIVLKYKNGNFLKRTSLRKKDD